MVSFGISYVSAVVSDLRSHAMAATLRGRTRGPLISTLHACSALGLWGAEVDGGGAWRWRGLRWRRRIDGQKSSEKCRPPRSMKRRDQQGLTRFGVKQWGLVWPDAHSDHQVRPSLGGTGR